MKKNIWFVFLVFVAGTLLAGRASVAEERSEALVFKAGDLDNRVCQPVEVNLSELAGKVKAHGLALRDLECASQDLSNRARLLANQADKATAEQKAEAEELKKQAKAVGARMKNIRAKAKEIEDIKGGSAFASNLRKFLAEEARKDANDAARAIAALSTKMDGLASRLSLVEGKVAAGEKILREHAEAINQIARDVAELKERGTGLGLQWLGLGSRGGMSSVLGLRLALPVSLNTEIGISAGAGVSSRGKVMAWDINLDVPTWVGGRFDLGPALFVSSTNTERQGVHNLMAAAGLRVGFYLGGEVSLIARAGLGPYLVNDETYFGWNAGAGLSYRFF